MIYYQNDGITNQHIKHGVSQSFHNGKVNFMYYSALLSSDSLFEELIEGKYSLIRVQA